MERENYFFGVDEPEKKDQVFALVIYDIVENKKRNRFAKLLKGYGTRIQKSGFEVKLKRSVFDNLVREAPKYCGKEDSIRIYKISGRSEVIKWGVDESVDIEDTIIM